MKPKKPVSVAEFEKTFPSLRRHRASLHSFGSLNSQRFSRARCKSALFSEPTLARLIESASVEQLYEWMRESKLSFAQLNKKMLNSVILRDSLIEEAVAQHNYELLQHFWRKSSSAARVRATARAAYAFSSRSSFMFCWENLSARHQERALNRLAHRLQAHSSTNAVEHARYAIQTGVYLSVETAACLVSLEDDRLTRPVVAYAAESFVFPDPSSLSHSYAEKLSNYRQLARQFADAEPSRHGFWLLRRLLPPPFRRLLCRQVLREYQHRLEELESPVVRQADALGVPLSVTQLSTLAKTTSPTSLL